MSTDMQGGQGPVEFNIGDLVRKSWELFVANVGVLLGGFIIYAVILFVPAWLSRGIANLVLSGPMTLGLALLTLAVVRGGRPDMGVLFTGFQRFLPAFLGGLVLFIFTAVGTILCILPGLAVAFIYMLTFFYMADKYLDFWPAMEASRKTVLANPGPWLMVLLTCFGLNVAGALVCGVGLLVSAPVTWILIALAYDQVEGAAAAEVAPVEDTP